MVALATALTPALAHAQAATTSASATQQGYVAVHVGGQAGSGDLVTGFTFDQYGENAVVDTTQEYGGGFLFNVEGGYRVRHNIEVGLALSRASSSADTVITARIPHPLVTDRPRTATLTTDDFNHAETGFHFFGRYILPVTDKIDVGVSAGPSFIRVSHEIVGNVTFDDPSPFTAVTLTGAPSIDRSKTVFAFNVGANATYHVTDQVGIDGFFRFARRSTDIEGIGAGSVIEDLKVGGAQFGIGVRYAF